MKFKHFFWDFDGTIFDSYPHTLRCCWDALEEAGLAEGWTKEKVLSWLLVSFGDMKRETGMPDDVYRRFVDRAHLLGGDEVPPRVIPFPDAGAVLSAVVRNGGKNYLYTHRNRTALWYLGAFGFAELFEDCLTAEEGFPAKPAPDAVLALIARNALDPAQCVMVGDREIDGMSGKNAGIAGALVHYPYALPDGSSPAARTAMDYTARSLTEFAALTGIF